jgi:GR25 family glycosyltransferase involved in LPS biosynthesis
MCIRRACKYPDKRNESKESDKHYKLKFTYLQFYNLKFRNQLSDQYQVGTPLVHSLYCTYGYSVNKTAAKFLLESTKKFNYPVDYWKLRLKDSPLRVGGILPNIITTVSSFKSTISHPNQNIFVLLFDTTINLKNSIISFFK